MPEVRSLLELSQGIFRRSFGNLAEDSQYEGVPAPNPDNSGGTPTGPSGGNNSGSDSFKDPNEDDTGGGRNDFGSGSYVPGSGVQAGTDRLNSGTDDGQTPEADPVGGRKYGGGGTPIDTRSDLEISVDKFANDFFGYAKELITFLFVTVGNQIYEAVKDIIVQSAMKQLGNKEKGNLTTNTTRFQLLGFLINTIIRNKDQILQKLKNNEPISFGFGVITNPKDGSKSHGAGDPNFSSHQLNFIPIPYRDAAGYLKYYIKVTITDSNGRILNEIDFK